MTSEGKYRLFLAILTGVGFTALVALLLNIPSPIVLVLSILLVPGSFFSHLLFHTQELGSPLAVLGFSAFVYSSVAYLGLRRWFRAESREARLPVLMLTIPVLLLASMACIPSISPLWPQGIAQLDATERKLRYGLPEGSPMEAARSFLQSQGIDTYQQSARGGEVVFQVGDRKMTADVGDRILSAQVPTAAWQFPCGYRIDVILIFGSDGKLRQNYIQRFRLCP